MTAWEHVLNTSKCILHKLSDFVFLEMGENEDAQCMYPVSIMDLNISNVTFVALGLLWMWMEHNQYM